MYAPHWLTGTTGRRTDRTANTAAHRIYELLDRTTNLDVGGRFGPEDGPPAVLLALGLLAGALAVLPAGALLATAWAGLVIAVLLVGLPVVGTRLAGAAMAGAAATE